MNEFLDKLDQAGMKDEETGALSRDLPVEGLIIPPFIEVTGEGDKAVLRWAAVSPMGEPNYGPIVRTDDTKGVLDEFIRLSEAPVANIEAFARKFGVLELCEHLVPLRHNPGCSPIYLEPIIAWRYHARRLRTMIEVAARLHIGELGDYEQWTIIYETNDDDPDDVFATSRWFHPDMGVGYQKWQLGAIVDRALMQWGAHVGFSWYSNEPQITIASRNLSGALVCQLAFAIGRVGGLATCTSCGVPYTPNRKPAKNRRNYCPKCAEGGRASKRDYARNRKK